MFDLMNGGCHLLKLIPAKVNNKKCISISMFSSVYIYIARIQIYIWTLILLYILWTHLYTFNGGIAPVTSRERNEAKVWELLHSPIAQVTEWAGTSQARQEQCPIHSLLGWNPACCWCSGAPSEAAWLAAGLPTSQPSHRERWYFLHKPYLLFPRPG